MYTGIMWRSLSIRRSTGAKCNERGTPLDASIVFGGSSVAGGSGDSGRKCSWQANQSLNTEFSSKQGIKVPKELNSWP